MDSSFLSLIAILILLFVLCVVLRMVLTHIRLKRINDFTILENDTNEIYDNIFVKFILSFGKLLKQLVIFNGVAKNYDRYINEDSKFKKGMDYIALKIVLGTLFSLIYVISSMLYINNVDLIIVILLFIIGLLVPDLYLFIKEVKKNKIKNNDILKVVIIMNNSFKANRSHEQALSDVISRSDGVLKEELQKVYKDIKLGLSYSNSFNRMMIRNNLASIKYLVNAFKLQEVSGLNIVDIFNNVENKMVKSEKINTEVDILRKHNIVSYIFFAVLPLILVALLVLSNNKYYDLIMGDNGYIVIIGELIVYIIYLIIIMFIEKGHKYE